eukprot:CAMPEP_0172491712 /NCGR_PEP_ID=MMETSP1066-20121228/22564_1 /TAXON_ID=671091 /ORGANISM="Coscinodiscus wailesii, Strain CCMP2513" /LENGTH=734 /DNA_ID=CAMNT_0013260883 /DNA_START=193 /DNA_END=2394 /DNA_ORIENTATION=+
MAICNAAFVPTPSLRTTVTRLHMSATNKQEQMTDQDEEILFGSSSLPQPPYPSRQRHISRTGNLLESSNLPLNPLDHSPTNPLINKLRSTRETLSSCPAVWGELSKLCPELPAIVDEHLCDEAIRYSFADMDEVVRRSAAVFRGLGVEKGVNVAILGENSARWLVADHGIQLAGGASAVRGADAPAEELRYVYSHSDSKNVAVVQGPKLVKRLATDAAKNNLSKLGLSNDFGAVKTIVLMHSDKHTAEDISELSLELNIEIHLLSDLLASVTPLTDYDLPVIGREDLATIVYTSGTTGNPKGVMLTHGNLLHQMNHRLCPTKPYEQTEPVPGDTMLALLPVWHITERTFELFMITRGCNVVYSSIRTFKNDLAKYKPHWMVLVPRVLEKVASGVQAKFAQSGAVAKTLVKIFTSVGKLKLYHYKIARGLLVADTPPSFAEKLKSKLIDLSLTPLHALGTKLIWSKVREGFGNRQKFIVSGGSALPGTLESFYEICGIPVIVGYGLTECSPLIAHRRGDKNLVTAGCVGGPTLDTELRVVDPDGDKPGEIRVERRALPDGEVGVVLARGPQIMRGYYKNPEATDKAIDSFGWFDTGDLGKVNPVTGDVILTGRCKDTIVLSNGENIEPQPIEDAILSQTNLIEQIMLSGQDGRSLTAICVLSPQELVASGFLDPNLGKTLQKENEKSNDPKCTPEDCDMACRVLNEAADGLRNNQDLKEALMADLRRATSKFRPW